MWGCLAETKAAPFSVKQVAFNADCIRRSVPVVDIVVVTLF